MLRQSIHRMAVAASRILFPSSAPATVGLTDLVQCPAPVRRLKRVSRLLPSLLNSVGYRLLAILHAHPVARGPSVPPSKPCGRTIRMTIITTSAYASVHSGKP